MYYTTNNVSMPTAHITKKKSRLKIYNGQIVFLNDKDNFEFEIHNPTSKSVLCKIKLNGNYISTSGIVIKPGQRVFLERFLDSNNKFEFSTYEVKDTSENRSAIDLNGEVKIEFYNEQEIVTYPHLSGGNWTNGWGGVSTGSPYYGTTFTTTAAYNSSNNSTLTFTNTSLNSPSSPRTLKKKSKSIETGRVEKGESSNQKFINSFENFNSYSFHQVSYKILPNSNKNVIGGEIKKFCSDCGVKVKSNYKFCPSCGYDLNSKKETIVRYTDKVNEIINGKNYMMSTFNLSLSKLLEIHSGKTIILHKPSLSENQLRAIIL